MKRKLINSLRLLLVAAGLCVGASAWGTETNATLTHTAGIGHGKAKDKGHTVDAAEEYYNNDNTSTNSWNGWAFAEFSLAELPEGETITSAILTWTATTTATARNHSIYYLSAGQTLDYSSIPSTTSTFQFNNNRTFIVTENFGYTATKSNDVTAAVRAIAASQDYIIFQWTNNAGAGNLAGKASANKPSLVITTSAETAYEVTFSETHGASVTVKIGEDNVTNGTVLINGSYNFSATAPGYENYEGSFTVNGANKNVSFTMTPKTGITSFTYKYMCSETLLETKTLADVTGMYVGDNYTAAYQKYWADGGNLYIMSETNTRKNVTLEATNEITVNYNLSASGNYYFYEFDGGYTTRANAESNGSAATQNANVTVPADGIYIVTANCYGSSDKRTGTVKVGSTTIVEATTLSIYAPGTNLISSPVALNKDDVINVTTSSSGDGIDYVILQKLPANVSVTVSTAGFATYVNSDFDLDFSTTDIKAYKVKVSTKGVAKLTKVNQVPAGTPVLLYKDGGKTEDIPVTTGASAVSDNDLVAGTGDAIPTSDGEGNTNMILNNVDSKIGFYFANNKTVAANRAYLHIATGLAPDAVANSRMVMVFADETTGITSLTPSPSPKGEGSVYTLSGQRVEKPAKGLYIVNGKKVVMK